MIHDVWFAVYHWCWREGVVGNIAASAILGVPSLILFWRKVMPKVREHLRKTHEIHAHLDPTNDFQIGRADGGSQPPRRLHDRTGEDGR